MAWYLNTYKEKRMSVYYEITNMCDKCFTSRTYSSKTKNEEVGGWTTVFDNMLARTDSNNPPVLDLCPLCTKKVVEFIKV